MANRGNLNIYNSRLESNVSRTLNVSQICRVIKLYENNKHADLQPMALTEYGGQRAMLIKVPVSLHCLEFITVGGIAVVLFTDRNMNHFDGSNKDFEIENGRSHDVNDGVVVGVL